MSFDQDTIVALATPPGRGGLAVVRLSGPDAWTVPASVLRLRHPLAAGRARFGELLDESTGAVLDQIVATAFAAPHSYTGEDVLELSMHGAPVLADYILRACLARGARLAEPGEFTRRALLEGRLELTQAEAVHDLVASVTLEQARVAASQLGGAVARAVAPAKEALLDLIAELEAGIDFAEDDLALLTAEAISLRIEQVRAPLTALASSFRYGRLLRDGATIALVGCPNAGKSSLFNRLLATERAIVTAQPGTTRDPIAERLNLAGVPAQLVDTAGLREAPPGAEGEAEREGIRRSRMALAEADLVLIIIDATTIRCTAEHAAVYLPQDVEVIKSLRERPYRIILNKIDLPGGAPNDPRRLSRDESFAASSSEPFDVIRVSAVTGDGMDELRAAITDFLKGDGTQDGAVLHTEQGVITSLRQQQAIAEALQALKAVGAGLEQRLAHEFLLLDLGEALRELDLLTGATADDEVLKRIFAKFCIGK